MPSPALLLTIGIPTYGRSTLVRAQVERLLPFLGLGVEILIQDNSSIDDTAAVAADLAKRDPRVRYQRNACNVGVDANVLRVLENARGTWCWLLGDDEPIEPSLLPGLLSHIAAERADLVHLVGPGLVLGADAHRRFETCAELVERFHDLGRFAHLSSFVFRVLPAREHVRSAYSSCGLLHSYAAVAARMLASGHPIVIHDGPLLSKPRTALRPRWNLVAAHLGAWQTMREAFPRSLRRRVDRRQASSRFKALFLNALLDAGGVRDFGLNGEEVRRLFCYAPAWYWPGAFLLAAADQAILAPRLSAASIVAAAGLMAGSRGLRRLRELYGCDAGKPLVPAVAAALRARARRRGKRPDEGY